MSGSTAPPLSSLTQLPPAGVFQRARDRDDDENHPCQALHTAAPMPREPLWTTATFFSVIFI